MKRSSNTYRVWRVAWAVLMVLILTLVPHHHHMGTVCMTAEVCADDGNVNDCHTDHGTAQAYPHVFYWQPAQKSGAVLTPFFPIGSGGNCMLLPSFSTLGLPPVLAVSRYAFAPPAPFVAQSVAAQCRRRGPPALIFG